jgi:hypothetical protein
MSFLKPIKFYPSERFCPMRVGFEISDIGMFRDGQAAD